MWVQDIKKRVSEANGIDQFYSTHVRLNESDSKSNTYALLLKRFFGVQNTSVSKKKRRERSERHRIFFIYAREQLRSPCPMGKIGRFTGKIGGL